eukprot:2471086-Prymnesium_polylepis.3
MGPSHGVITWRHHMVSSHGVITWRHHMASSQGASHGVITSTWGRMGSHGVIWVLVRLAHLSAQLRQLLVLAARDELHERHHAAQPVGYLPEHQRVGVVEHGRERVEASREQHGADCHAGGPNSGRWIIVRRWNSGRHGWPGSG